MKRMLIVLSIMLLGLSQAVSAHDPRTVARDFTHAMAIEGAGKFSLTYKSLHFNEVNFNNRKAERALTAFNRVWKSIGKLDVEFEIVIGGVKVPKGSYVFGINYDANDNFKLVLASGGSEITAPLQFATDSPVVKYLSFDLRPDNDTDAFTIEGRYGPARVWAEVKVPYLAPHGHEKKN
jgi:opacity protein-like surface antigen